MGEGHKVPILKKERQPVNKRSGNSWPTYDQRNVKENSREMLFAICQWLRCRGTFLTLGEAGVGHRLLTAHVGGCLGQALVESNLAKNVKVLRTFILFDPVIPVLGMWPREIALKMENAFHSVLFMIVKYWGKPAIEEWLAKLWFVQLMEYYVAIQNI